MSFQTDGNGKSAKEADTGPSDFLQALVPAEMQWIYLTFRLVSDLLLY